MLLVSQLAVVYKRVCPYSMSYVILYSISCKTSSDEFAAHPPDIDMKLQSAVLVYDCEKV